MKKIQIVLAFSLFVLILSFPSVAQRNFKTPFEIKAGSYLFNSTSVFFFDDGIDCYLSGICNDIDTVFENSSVNFKISNDTIVKVQAYLYTDNYEYMYVKLNKSEGWLRADVPLDKEEEVFLKRYLLSANFESLSCYVEVIPFKDTEKVFVSTTDDWYIANIKRKRAEFIGTKGGRLEACQMVFPKNCVKCYIDLGWGEERWYDENGKERKMK
ncbi:MAG: hypothetical protein JXL97_15200 [Bacteroidales bacterium]|nr:hypothetical protein [Bacteroidales bacterium]